MVQRADPDVDVIVVGGGVNGTGVARDCALRGLRVALLERNDLAFGASGNSSGLIHGGPRYMTQNPDVTYTSCLDSGNIQRIAPHLLFRVPVMLPVLRHAASRTELDLIDAFFGAYDRYQPLKRGKPHTRLSGAEVKELEPGLQGDFEGAVTFDEWGIDGARLCVANARDAVAHGAQVLLPVSVMSLIRRSDGSVAGVEYEHRLTGERASLRARVVVNATGAWSPLVVKSGGVDPHRSRVRPGKGIHVYLDRRLSDYAIMVKAIDGRRVFIEPWQNTSVLGTTDDDYYGDLDNVFATSDEVRYLTEAIAQVLPEVRNARAIGTWAGVRPTLFAWGKLEDALSREHEIVDHAADGAKGLVSLIGGKLASYRLFAEEATNEICAWLDNRARCVTHERPLPGGEATPAVDAVAALAGIDRLSAARLTYRHGSAALTLAQRMADAPEEREIVCACEPVTRAEVRFSVEQEWAYDVNSVSRRTRLGTGSCGGMLCTARCAELVARFSNGAPAMGRQLARDFMERQSRHRLSVLNSEQLRQELLLRANADAHLGGAEEL